MAKFRKKPVTIDAHEVRCADWPDWMVEAIESGAISVEDGGTMSIKTLEGTMRAERNDWIIKGVKGELYPVKPEIFALTYEHMDEEEI